ncbi:MAG: peptidase T [Pyrinomonadaceae bacterium]
MKFFLSAILFTLFIAATASAQLKPPTEQALDRFLRYVKIDTQSAEDQATVPSTKKQFDLARLLEQELKALGAQDVYVSEFGIVYGRVLGNLADNSSVPVIGLISHMDTSPSASGANVNPIMHKNYQGGDIVLPNDKSQVITVAKNPILKSMIGDDIITADGTTLLGSDDKSGISAILTMVDTLRQNPQIKHGTIAIAFTPDEEVGGGIEKFDIPRFGAKFAYTVDGEELGTVSNETWNAKTAIVTFKGQSTHPGTAKNVLVNSMYAAASYLSRFPKNMLPETTDGRIGFVHPYDSKLDIEESKIKVLLRDFTKEGIAAKEKMLSRMVAQTKRLFPKVGIEIRLEDGYQNMIEGLKEYPQLTDNALEAARRAGLNPRLHAIRGGTDGARLTFQGLPCPDIFTGGQNFHGKLEFNSRRGMEKTTETLVNLVQIWTEKK